MIAALDRKLLRDLWRLRGQLVAIILVVASGVSTFVAMLSTLDSLDRARWSFYDRHSFPDVFAHLERAPESVRDRLALVAGVRAVETRIVADVTLDVEGSVEAVTGRLLSLPDAGRPGLNDIYLRRGRMPEAYGEDEVLVSEGFAEAHGLMPGDAVTAILNQRRHDLRIVGIALSPEYVYSIPPGGLIPDARLFGVFWMRRQGLATAFDMDGAFNSAVFSLRPNAVEDQVLADIDAILETNGGLGAIHRRDTESDWFVENELAQLRGTGLVMPIVFLGVAAFLLNVALSRMLGQQRDQIAVLKAFGYSTFQVGAHYLKLVLVVVLLAGLLGALGGAWMGRGMVVMYGDFLQFPSFDYYFDLRHLARGMFIGAAAAVLGTFHAIRGAVRLPPAEAMRPPAPPSYRPVWIERLGLMRFLSMPMRIVLRDMGRRPVRSGLSALGISCGVALIVVGHAFADSMDFIVETQFGIAQREDMTVNLGMPRSSKALHEISGLPGVRRAEPFRTVATRVHAGHRSRRIGIIGLTEGATLHRLLDVETQPVELPVEGLVLSSRLAQALEVGEGDRVTVEVLQESQPVLDLEIARIVETYIGIGAYMRLSALNRAMGEGATISGAYLLTDEARLPELHRRLKETPVVSGVGLRKSMLKSFEDTAGQSTATMSFFMILFAVVIAGGVVYNTARILLSERGRELASMRVLGYRRSEISWILLGELWLLTALAIPLGLFLGYVLTGASLAALDTELFSLPLVITPSTYGIAAVVVALAAIASGLLVRRRLDRLDLIEVLKTRE